VSAGAAAPAGAVSGAGALDSRRRLGRAGAATPAGAVSGAGAVDSRRRRANAGAAAPAGAVTGAGALAAASSAGPAPQSRTQPTAAQQVTTGLQLPEPHQEPGSALFLLLWQLGTGEQAASLAVHAQPAVASRTSTRTHTGPEESATVRTQLCQDAKQAQATKW